MGYARKLERNKLMVEYRNFCKAWMFEKKMRQDAVDKIGKEQGHAQLLGPCPTFNMWKKAVDNKKIHASTGAEVVNTKKVELKKEDLTWE
jgi:hypothetical protein